MNNILQMIKMFKSPKDAVLNMYKNNSNPIFKQLIEYAEQGQNDKIEVFARNYAKEHNIDFDKEINNLQNILGLFNSK